MFSNIPIGSAVAVQCEDGGPWNHGSVVNTGSHNHHDRSYIIQLTINGRCISRNRWHIKSTKVTADTYLQHQANKQSNTKTDPLTEILNIINRNPAIYVTRQGRIINNTCEQYNEQTTKKKLFKRRQTLNKTIKRQTTVRREEVLKKVKLIEQDLDTLSENQTDLHVCSHSNILANMSATPQMLYGWCHYFAILSIFFV